MNNNEKEEYNYRYCINNLFVNPVQWIIAGGCRRYVLFRKGGFTESGIDVICF